MSRPYFGVYYLPPDGSAPQLCEIDGGICYEAYRTHEAARRSAERSNESHPNQYTVKPIPSGIRVHDYDSDSVEVSGPHLGQEQTIVEAFKAPAYVSTGMRPAVMQLVSAYRYHRQAGKPAVTALTAARQDLTNGTERYAGGRYAYGKPFAAYGSKQMRFVENIDYAGLRFVDYADKIASCINHTGWWLDPHGYGESVRGAVYQLAGRNGRPLFVAGYEDPNISDAACLDFSEIFEGEQSDSSYYTHDAAVDAARHADSIAESYAEKERDYQRAWQAGQRYYELGESIKDNRSQALALFAERRAARNEAGNYPTICKLIESQIAQIWESIQEKRAERAKLESGDHDEYWFSDSDRSAFLESACIGDSLN